MWQRWFLFLLVFELFSFVSFAYGQLSIEALTPFVETSGSEQAINLVVTFTNNTEKSISNEPVLKLPIGWHSLIPLGIVNVLANESITIPFTIQIPKSTTAGNYDISVATQDNNSAAIFTISIAAVTNLTTTIENLPNRIIAAPYSFDIVLNNSGNQALALAININDNLGFPISLDQQRVNLEPQQQEVIEVNVVVPDSLNKQVTQLISIITYDIQSLERISHNSVSAILIPSQVSKFANWQRLPVSLSISTERLNFNNSETLLEDISIALSGRGNLTDTTDDILDFDINTDALLTNSQFQIRYTSAKFGVSIANRNLFSHSNILAYNQNGIQSNAYYNVSLQKNLSLTPYLYASTENGIGFGIRSHYIFDILNISKNFNGAVEGYLPYEGNSLFALRANYQTFIQNFWTTFNIDYIAELLEADSGLAGQLNLSTQVNSAGHLNLTQQQNSTVQSNVQTISHSFGITYRNTRAGFKASQNNSSNLNFNYAIRIRDLQLFINSYAALAWKDTSVKQNTNSNNSKFGLSVNYTQDKLNWHLNSEYNSTTNTTTAESWTTSLRLLQRFNRLSYLQQQLSLIYFLNADTKDKLRYRTNLVYPIDSGSASANISLRPSLMLEWYLEDFSLIDLHSSLAVTLPTNFGEAALTLSYNPYRDAYLTLNAKGTFDIDTRNTFVLESGSILSENNGPDFYISAAHKHKLDIPISKKTKIATVRGVLIDSQDTPLSNTLVEVSGQFIQTNAQGQFEIVSVPKNEAYFKIAEGQLPAGKRTIPESPYFFKAEAGELYNFEFTVIDSASVNFNVRYEDANLSDDVLISEIDIENIFSKLAIKLTSATGKQKTVRANSDGLASLVGIIPGDWNVSATLGRADSDVNIEIGKQQLNLQEADIETIDIVISPKVRKIKFIDSGTVTLELDSQDEEIQESELEPKLEPEPEFKSEPKSDTNIESPMPQTAPKLVPKIISKLQPTPISKTMPQAKSPTLPNLDKTTASIKLITSHTKDSKFESSSPVEIVLISLQGEEKVVRTNTKGTTSVNGLTASTWTIKAYTDFDTKTPKLVFYEGIILQAGDERTINILVD